MGRPNAKLYFVFFFLLFLFVPRLVIRRMSKGVAGIEGGERGKKKRKKKGKKGGGREEEEICNFFSFLFFKCCVVYFKVLPIILSPTTNKQP